MSINLINRIKAANGRTVKHGRYSYRLNVWTGWIYRALTEDVGKLWITYAGEQRDAWEQYAQLYI